jgi:hypothetical protein
MFRGLGYGAERTQSKVCVALLRSNAQAILTETIHGCFVVLVFALFFFLPLYKTKLVLSMYYPDIPNCLKALILPHTVHLQDARCGQHAGRRYKSLRIDTEADAQCRPTTRGSEQPASPTAILSRGFIEPDSDRYELSTP